MSANLTNLARTNLVTNKREGRSIRYYANFAGIRELIGFLMEDLMQSGFCPACISESVDAAFERCKADRDQHKADDDPIIPRSPDDVFH